MAVLVNRVWLLYDDAIYEFWSFAWRLCQILWGEEIQMEVPHQIDVQDQDEHNSLSSHESISPKPNVIYVKSCSESANVECHIWYRCT